MVERELVRVKTSLSASTARHRWYDGTYLVVRYCTYDTTIHTMVHTNMYLPYLEIDRYIVLYGRKVGMSTTIRYLVVETTNNGKR